MVLKLVCVQKRAFVYANQRLWCSDYFERLFGNFANCFEMVQTLQLDVSPSEIELVRIFPLLITFVLQQLSNYNTQ